MKFNSIMKLYRAEALEVSNVLLAVSKWVRSKIAIKNVNGEHQISTIVG